MADKLGRLKCGRYTLDPAHFADTLRSARESKGIPIRTLASKAGVGSSTVFRAEGGNYRVQFDTLLRLLAALDLTPLDVLTLRQSAPTESVTPAERELLKALRKGNAEAVMKRVLAYLADRPTKAKR